MGQYVISYCLKGEKVTQRKENSNFDSATATALKQGQVKEFSKQKILSNILTCKLKKGLDFSTFRLRTDTFTKKTLETTELRKLDLNSITCSNPKPFPFLIR